MRTAAVAALAVLVGAACGPRGPASKAPVVATMVREACLDDCPVYTVTLYRDGVVEYHGKYHVAKTGRHVGKVDPAVVANVEAVLERAAFARVPDYSQADCYDLPGVKLTYRGRTLDHYHGDRAAPMELYVLEHELDELIGTARWVGTPRIIFGPWCTPNAATR
jgi:hypothetical protein